MNKNTRILLLSDEKKNYDMFKRQGFINVVWYKSILKAYEHLIKNPDEFLNYGLLVLADSVVKSSHGINMQPIYNAAFLSDVPFISYSTNFSEKGDEYSSYHLSIPMIISSLSEANLFGIIHDVEVEDRCELIHEKPVEYVDKIKDKDNKDIKVMFIGPRAYFECVTDYFRKHDLNNVICRESRNDFLPDAIPDLIDCDLVISDDSHNYSLVRYNNELSGLLEETEQAIFLVSFSDQFNIFPKEINVNSSNTVDEIREKGRFSSLRSREEALDAMLDSIMGMYSHFNKKLNVGEIKTLEEFKKMFEEDYKKYIEERKSNKIKVDTISIIEDTIRKYIRRKGDSFSKDVSFEGLEINKLSDGVSVAFKVGNREIARITFLDKYYNSIHPGYKVFSLEAVNEKGKLCTLGERLVYIESRYIKDVAPQGVVLSDEEFSKINGIYKKMSVELIPYLNGNHKKVQIKRRMLNKRKELD